MVIIFIEVTLGHSHNITMKWPAGYTVTKRNNHIILSAESMY